MNWNTSPKNLLFWTDKGAIQLKRLIPAFKKTAPQDGANPLPFYMFLNNELMETELYDLLANLDEAEANL